MRNRELDTKNRKTAEMLFNLVLVFYFGTMALQSLLVRPPG